MLPTCISYYRKCSSSEKRKIVNIKPHILYTPATLSFRGNTSTRKNYMGGFKGCQTGGTLPEMYSTWFHRSSVASLLCPRPVHQPGQAVRGLCASSLGDADTAKAEEVGGKQGSFMPASSQVCSRLTGGQYFFFLSISSMSGNVASEWGFF